MVLHLIVENFGKVQFADIELSNMVVLVGNNNSGKTMLMQLIYGIQKKLVDLPISTEGSETSDLHGQWLVRCAQNWFDVIIYNVNEYLQSNKENIVREIFGTNIPIGSLQISLDDTENTYYVGSMPEFSDESQSDQGISIDIREYENGINKRFFEVNICGKNTLEDAIQQILKLIWRIILTDDVGIEKNQLFLPASRSGLQLLYRYYFAEDTKRDMVLPIKDFLRFLQLYSPDIQLDASRSSLLEFGEAHMLQGKVFQRENELFYIENQNGKEIPLYIASSMIHELTPFVMALTSTQKINWLFCDEVETSLHPLMQREMARWLIRMVNEGMHVIISSHSDTMASRLNNLLMLTALIREKANYTILEELGLVEADLLNRNATISVYEFHSNEMGNSVVKKLKFISCPLMGYDFQLFSKNLDKLYDEADKITGN